MAISPVAPDSVYPLVAFDVEASDRDGNVVPAIGANGAVFVSSIPAACGDGVPELDEQCDDGNTFGGDGCAANCTTESARTLLAEPDGSASLIQTSAGLFPFTRDAALPIVIGQPRLSDPSRVVPLVVRAAGLPGEQIAVPGLGCLCLRVDEFAPFGPGNAGTGRVGCSGAGLANTDVTTQLDHNISDVDPACVNGSLEGPAAPHPGTCNGAPQVDFSGGGGRGSALITLNTAVRFIADGGTCADDPSDPAKGPDGTPCTTDDTAPEVFVLQQVTTGRAAAAVLDANNVPGDAIPPAMTCGTAVCFVEDSGVPLNCDELLAASASDVRSGARASAFPLLDLAGIGDAVIISRLAPPPTLTPTPTPTPTPTRTRTSTATPTETRTFTPAPAPAALVLRRLRLRANTSARAERPNGSAAVRAVLNANAPFGNLVDDILAAGVSVRITGAGGVEMTLAWPASSCRSGSTRRGPRLDCTTADASGHRVLVLRPTATVNVFELRISARDLDFAPPLAPTPVRVILTTRSHVRQDDIYRCEVSGGQSQLSRCGESGVVPTPTPGAPLGERVFSIARPGSALLSSALAGFDISVDPWLTEPLRLRAGVPDVDGVAPLELAADTLVGFTLVEGSTVCLKIFAAGSHGGIDCDGGSAHDTLSTWDSNGSGYPSDFVATGGLGSDAGPGAATLYAGWTAYTLGPGGSVFDCPYFYYYPPSLIEVFTTATATGTFIEPIQGGDVTITATGEHFNCSRWTQEDGPGRLLTPILATDTIVGDVANMLVLVDAPTTPLPPVPTPTQTPTPTVTLTWTPTATP